MASWQASWFQSRALLAAAFKEWFHVPETRADDLATALIARLAQADPPLLICTPDEIKEET